ncbi:MAG: hypothetical protein N3D18_11435 [Roseococcus sp.]|nr:hypothetical protein [Roseococcus sp.]
MRRRHAAALLLALGACAELWTPPPPPPPGELAGDDVAAPLRAVARRALADFAPGGAGLAGPPEAVALAAARLEWLGGETRPGGGLARIEEDFRFALAAAVEEQRAALGLAPEASPEQAIAALLAARRALMRGERAAAEAALVPPVFRPGLRPGPLARLAAPGPRPNAQLVLPGLVAALERAPAARLEEGGVGFGVGEGGLSPFTLPRR